jgi:DNA-binding response OmpR family regulator
MPAERPILIVEDDPILCETLLDQLADDGEFAGTPAAWLQEAEAELSAPNARFDAILLDVGLPDGDAAIYARVCARAGTKCQSS